MPPRSKTATQILVNLLTGWGSIVVRTVLALLLVPFLLARLGREGYGIIGLLGVYMSLAGVADLGLRAALGRELAEAHARGDDREFRELMSTGMGLYLGIGCAISLLGIAAAPALVGWMKIPAPHRETAIALVRYFGSASVLLSFCKPVYTSAMTSTHRFDIVNWVTILSGILGSLALFLVVPRSPNPVYGWALVILSVEVAGLVALVGLLPRVCPRAGLHPKHFRVSRIPQLFKLGSYMYAIQISQVLSERTDPLVISFFHGPSSVALYQPGSRVSEMVRPFVSMLSDQLYPLATRHHVDSAAGKMRDLLLLGTKFTLLLGVLCTAMIIVFSEPFCRLWLEKSLGEDYRVTARIMAAWGLADLTTYASGTQWPVLLGMKRLRFLVWTQLPSAVVNLAVSCYFVGYTRLGIVGVLAATIAIGFIRRPLMIWYTARQCSIPWQEYFRVSYARPLVCLAIALAAGALIQLGMPLRSYPALLMGGGIVFAAWLGACWGVGLGSEERKRIRSALDPFRAKFRTLFGV